MWDEWTRTAASLVVVCRNSRSRNCFRDLTVQTTMHLSAPLATLHRPMLPTAEHLLSQPPKLASPDLLHRVACTRPDSPPLAQQYRTPLHSLVYPVFHEPHGVRMKWRAPQTVFEHREVIRSGSHSHLLLQRRCVLLWLPPLPLP